MKGVQNEVSNEIINQHLASEKKIVWLVACTNCVEDLIGSIALHVLFLFVLNCNNLSEYNHICVHVCPMTNQSYGL